MIALRISLFLALIGFARGESPIRIGLIGLDTSHVVAFASALNDTDSEDHVPGGRIVAAYKGGSDDIERSWSRIDGFTETLQQEYGVEIYDTIGEVCESVDALMLTSVDGRKHLPQIREMLDYGKPIFIDKPMGGSLAEVVEIFRLAEAADVPVFSSSSLRYGKQTQAARHGAIGQVFWAETFSPCHLEPTHPDLFWYGVHGVESLFTVMGTGCTSVRRGLTEDGRIEVAGTWKGDRIGIYRESVKGYGGFAAGKDGQLLVGENEGKGAFLEVVLRFFETGEVPIEPAETIELFAFMQAAERSKERGGAEVELAKVLQEASYQR